MNDDHAAGCPQNTNDPVWLEGYSKGLNAPEDEVTSTDATYLLGHAIGLKDHRIQLGHDAAQREIDRNADAFDL